MSIPDSIRGRIKGFGSIIDPAHQLVLRRNFRFFTQLSLNGVSDFNKKHKACWGETSAISNQGCICNDHKQSTRSKPKASWHLTTMSCFRPWETICCTIAFWKSFENKNIYATNNGLTGKI